MKILYFFSIFILLIVSTGCTQRGPRSSFRQPALRPKAVYSPVQPASYPAPTPLPTPTPAPTPLPPPPPPPPLVKHEPMPVPMPATSSSVSTKKEVGMILPPMQKKRKFAEKGMIIIDPGHGGDDYGTHSHGKPTYHEKYLNLSTAEMLKGFLQKYGYRVVMTRTDDTFISLENRAIFANEKGCKLFVSVHYNSAPSRDAEGVEVFFYRQEKNKSRTAQSKILAQCVLDKVIKNTNAKSRGIKHGDFAVIRETTMPAILIEGGFLTNSNEMDKIKTKSYQKNIAQGIAQGIKDYLAKENVLAEK